MKNIKFFILSGQSLSLYRQFMKIIYRIDDQSLREDVKRQVKSDYEKYRNVEDLHQLEYLIVTGRKQLKML